MYNIKFRIMEIVAARFSICKMAGFMIQFDCHFHELIVMNFNWKFMLALAWCPVDERLTCAGSKIALIGVAVERNV